MVKIGAHVSTSGGLNKAIERAQAIGAEAIQIFSSSPQSWRRRTLQEAEVEVFRRSSEETGISPAFIHGPYLINLAGADPANLSRSEQALVNDLHVSAQIGAAGVIFHIGSHKGAGYDQAFHQVVAAVRNVLARAPAEAWLILENSAGMGGSIGSRFAELGAIIREVNDPRVKVCLDTQHSFAAGYDFASKGGLDAAMEEFEREVGWPLLVAVHANDSKCPLGGGLDRHENIGAGYMGIEGFEVIINHPAFQDAPWLLEVPGFNKEGPDRENVDILRSLRGNSRGPDTAQQ